VSQQRLWPKLASALKLGFDGDLDSLTAPQRDTLIKAAKAVRELPEVAIVSLKLAL
jgi:hypothetical protein